MSKQVVVVLVLTAMSSLAAKPCEDCWDDTCKQFKGALPKCAAPVKPKAPVKKKGVELNVKSTPAGAAVIADGITLGKTPWRGRLDAAPQTLELSLAGFEPVTLEPKAPFVVNQKLVPVTKRAEPAPAPAPLPAAPRGGLVVTSAPPGAAVTLDGRAVGVTPFNDASVSAGPHRVELTLQGYDGVAAEVTAPAQPSFTLFPADTPVVIESSPPGATVTVDGRRIGSTPLVARLGPGRRVVRLELSGHQRVDAEKELLPSETPTWSWNLTADAPMVPMLPPAPAMPPLSSPVEAATPDLASLLGDESVDLEKKRSALQRFSVMTDDVTRFVFAAQPQKHRDALCDTFRMKVRTSRLVVQVFDSYGDEARGFVDLDGHRLGRSPFDGNVPVCARSITVTLGEEVVTRERQLDGAGKVERFDMPGRQRRVSFSAFIDQLWLPALTQSDLNFDERDASPSNTGFGVRFDMYGKIIHGSVALKASQLYGASIFQQPFRSFGPSADLYIGLTTAAGNDLVRYRFAFDVGAWSMVCPSVRLVNTVSLFEHLFFTLTFDGAWVPPQLISTVSLTPDRTLGLGLSFAIGGGF